MLDYHFLGKIHTLYIYFFQNQKSGFLQGKYLRMNYAWWNLIKKKKSKSFFWPFFYLLLIRSAESSEPRLLMDY